MKYLSDGTWFEKGTVCKLVDDYRPEMNSGLFSGLRKCKNPSAESRLLDELYDDEEICSFNEFESINE